MVHKSTHRAEFKCYLLQEALPDCSHPINIRLGLCGTCLLGTHFLITKSVTFYTTCWEQEPWLSYTHIECYMPSTEYNGKSIFCGGKKWGRNREARRSSPLWLCPASQHDPSPGAAGTPFLWEWGNGDHTGVWGSRGLPRAPTEGFKLELAAIEIPSYTTSAAESAPFTQPRLPRPGFPTVAQSPGPDVLSFYFLWVLREMTGGAGQAMAGVMSHNRVLGVEVGLVSPRSSWACRSG